MFAVVTISGKQYKVAKGDVIVVEKLDGAEGDVVEFDHVLLTADEGKAVIGTPVVKGGVVKAKILAQQKGEKIHVRRYKQKVRYRKSRGFRAQETKLEILSIS